MTSIIVPAHNEEAVVARCLQSIREDARAEEYEVIVVANGCSDATAAVARSTWPRIRVIELETPSKTEAMNVADGLVTGFPRIYLDADVQVTPGTISTITSRMEETGAPMAAPAMEINHRDASWPVRAYYDVWRRLPYVEDGMVGVGMYALSEEGRRRFGKFPAIISDDGYVRRLFQPGERLRVAKCKAIVTAPRSLWGLIKTKTRSRLGGYELSEKFPELSKNEPKDYLGALRLVLRSPSLWSAAWVYAIVTAVVSLRAKRMHWRRLYDVWERDESSRQ